MSSSDLELGFGRGSVSTQMNVTAGEKILRALDTCRQKKS